MSLATRCPTCGTIFRVVQDQLKVSEGWVRCGQCNEVFHGLESLFDLDSDQSSTLRRQARGEPPAAPLAHVFDEPPAPNAQGAHDAPGTDAVLPPVPVPPSRGTIAPRFAARLAEDSARALAAAAMAGAASADGSAGAAGLPADPQVRSDLVQSPTWFASTLSASAFSELDPTAFVPPARSNAAALSFSAPYVPIAGLLNEPSSKPVSLPTVDDAIEARQPRMFVAPDSVVRHVERPVEPPDEIDSIPPSMLADDAADEDDAAAGSMTYASMLPEDAGEWPPRNARRRRRQPRRLSAAPAPIPSASASADPRFLREAQRDARWRKPWIRVVSSVVLVGLVATLAGQLAWPQRDVLAARWPETLPAWQWACRQARCTIAAPRALASLALDGSSLTRTDTEHVLLFSADLHNRADHEVRMPSFDLTFMDLNGAIVARKVLSPAQIGIRQAALSPDAEVHVHARLQVGALDASGFQAEMFYP